MSSRGDLGGGPVYHRKAAPTQTAADAAQQQASGELWGYPAIYSNIPAVKAYAGPLPPGERGIEFTTTEAPDMGGHPRLPTWSGKDREVVGRDGRVAARIRATITRIVY